MTEADVLTMYRIFYKDIDPKEARRYRNRPVIITGSKYAVTEVEKIQEEIDRLFEWAAKDRDKHH
nr:Fic family protein [Thermicanus aegyptius]